MSDPRFFRKYLNIISEAPAAYSPTADADAKLQSTIGDIQTQAAQRVDATKNPVTGTYKGGGVDTTDLMQQRQAAYDQYGSERRAAMGTIQRPTALGAVSRGANDGWKNVHSGLADPNQPAAPQVDQLTKGLDPNQQSTGDQLTKGLPAATPAAPVQEEDDEDLNKIKKFIKR